MIERLKYIFELNKNNIAYKNNDESISYGELLSKVTYYSNLLKKQGIEPVIIYGHKSIDMVVSILSCLFANRTYIPVDTCTPTIRLKKIINLSKASLIIKNQELDIDEDIEFIKLDELKKYENFNTIDNKIENDIAYIIFTSGSTGEPKGVSISVDNLFNFCNWISNFRPLDTYKNINVLNQASFSFDLSVADLYYSLFNGHKLVGLNKEVQENYNDIFNIIKNENINVMVSTPTFIKMCLINPDFTKENYPSIKCMYFCGEVLEKKVANKILSVFPNISIINAYGSTEATSAVTGILINKEIIDTFENLPVGEIKHSAVDIVIEDEEIVLKGNSVFSGYLNINKSSCYKENGINCYKTGDIGYIENGKLFFCCRKDNQIKYKGYRIELNDIEENINKIKGVKDCVVVSKLNGECAVKMIKAFVILEDSYDEEYVRGKLSEIMPSYMIPKIIKKVDKFPINKNFKIDRKLLSEL